jgi:peptidoglycan/xylan/chitin deacetylase (PgdA/CDA1 family)
MKINQSTGYDDALTGKNLYLTIDDGPSGNNTPKVLATLKKYNVKATFFVCGPDTPAVRNLIRQEFDDGHAIGVHCYSHFLKSLYQSEESFFADFDKIEKLIFEVTGVKPTLYRFPGGTNTAYIKKELSDNIIVKLKERGYEYYDWNVSSGDSQPYPPEELTSRIVSNCEKRKQAASASIILMHDSVSRVSSADALETFLPELLKRGYYFSTLSHVVKPVHFIK